MKNLEILAEKLKVYPKLRLGIKKAGGGVEPTGPHRVKFLEEPSSLIGKDSNGAPRQELKFIVEEDGIKYRWQIPIMSKEGQPSYLWERLIGVKVGDERILEMMKQGIKNYIDVRMIDEEPEPPEETDYDVPVQETKTD